MKLSAKHRARLTLICYLFLASTATVSAQGSTETTTTVTRNANNTVANLYGLGIRLGFYFQALAFLIGFANVIRLDPKSQFSGVILAIDNLIRWFLHLKDHDASAAELWVGLALILVVAVPGMWLLFWTLEAQRRSLQGDYGDKYTTFMEITQGQTLNILQALFVFVCTVIANSWFSYWIISVKHGETYPPGIGTKNEVWIGTMVPVSSSWVKIFMVSQAALGTVCTVVPAFVYVLGACFSIIAYWFPGSSKIASNLPVADKRGGQTRLTTKRWGAAFGAVLLAFGIALLLSIELTIKGAGLKAEADIQAPGQLLPLIAGAISVLSSFGDALGWHIARVRQQMQSNIGPYTQVETGRDGEVHVSMQNLQQDSYGSRQSYSGSGDARSRGYSDCFASAQDPRGAYGREAGYEAYRNRTYSSTLPI